MCLGTTGNAGAPYADYFRQQNPNSPIARSQGGSVLMGALMAKRNNAQIGSSAAVQPRHGPSPSFGG